ncbi:helicase-exonuclease AddAB subunit AddB [Metallumcola ferriviriculae]|uniref:Helicase-exonuclease AddAB subunit AddB n=1 Tax=Metallumcola ferriviriculae TaxID=3039180 RepID=A0AAU0UM63_9FIRM|nr:helicase-exonuclease AddAB subunit AddB [Desulfitibacteraceae bacterium MK1]
MSVTFILGRAGSGKTHFCLEEIKEELLQNPEGPPLIFLVPEQATFQLERELINTPGLDCFARVQVLSFRRLAFRIFQQTGGMVRPHISEMGKRMLIRSVLAKEAKNLKLFSHLSGDFGFCDTVASSISEFKMYGLAAEELECEAAALVDNVAKKLLADKLHDMAIAYQGLETALDGRYTDPDDYMRWVAEKMPESDLIQGAKVWVDGFSGFTVHEYAVLAQLFSSAAVVKMALCLPHWAAADKLSEHDIFYPTWRTYQQLLALSAETGAAVEKTVKLEGKPPRFNNPWLQHLEAQLSCWPGEQKEGQPQGIRVTGAANRRTEIETAARQMIALARDRDWRWREMSVMCRGLEPYADLVRTIFKDYGIPFFIDKSQGVAHHPLVELLRSSMETVASNWRHEVVFRCLKTDLLPLDREEVDRLENYCLACGIEGSLWTMEHRWQYIAELDLENNVAAVKSQEDYLADINELRDKVRACFQPLAQFSSGRHKVREISRACWQYLDLLAVAENMAVWRDEDERQGDLTRAQEHVQVWDQVIELLDQMVECLGEEELTLREYLTILEAGLEQLKVGLIPPGLDQVLVGSIDRSRNPNVKALFFLGANDGIFPRQFSEEQIFGDEEREYLQAEGLEIALSSRMKLLEEQYFIYIGMTRASQYLSISYALADEEGKEMRPSAILHTIKNIFPQLEIDYCGMEPEGECQTREYLVPGPGSIILLINKLRQVKEGAEFPLVWQNLFNFYLNRNSTRDLLLSLLGSLSFSPSQKNLSDDSINQLYSNPIKVSVSRLEQYARCPFSYFAEHVLKLRERRQLTLDALNLGKIYHQILSEFVLNLEQEQLLWKTLDAVKKKELADRVLAQIHRNLERTGLLKDAKNRYLLKQVRENIYYALDILTEHAQRGEFVTRWVETSFDRGGQLQPLEVQVNEKWSLMLRGRVDRIDLTDGGGKKYLRIVDYKTNDTRFHWWQFYYGLQLQLLTYLWAAVDSIPALVAEEVAAAGAFYFPVSRPLVASNGPLTEEAAHRQVKLKSKMQGVLLRDHEAVSRMGVDGVGYSDLLPVQIKKDGDFGGGRNSSNLLTNEQLSQVLKFTESKIRQLGKKIAAGEIRAYPYWHKKDTPCGRCGYKPICWFDSSFSGCGYNFLRPMNDQQLLENICQYGEGGEE